jgi:hypothetical protein
MCDSLIMQILEGLQKLIHDGGNFFLLQLVLFDMFIELSARDLFHDDEHVLLRLIGLLHLNYVGVTDPFDDLDLFPEELPLSVR